jgi:hypothetical protein
MPPAFLNSREDAGLVWTIVVLAFVIYKVPGVLGNFVHIIWLAVRPPLGFLFGGAAIYCAGIVAAASVLGVWEKTDTKETVYWFLGTGLVLAGHATSTGPDPAYARKLLRRAFKVAILIEFIVNFYVFPLGVELVFLPLVGFLGIMEVWNKAQPEPDPTLARVTGNALAILGWAVLVSLLVRIGLHPGRLLSWGSLEHLLVVPALTLAFVPFLCLIAWWSRRQRDAIQRRFALASIR